MSDKTGLVRLAAALHQRGVALLSSGGTAKALMAEKIPVETVESYTGSPEVMDGRVKTLHPRVHGGILAREGTDDSDLARLGARPIDLVIVNLYPFEKVLSNPMASFEELIENIDIGGPSMVRSAAKNHARVAVVCDPADYERVLGEIETTGGVSAATRRELAAKAFAHTAAYDGAISAMLSGPRAADPDGTVGATPYPRFLTLAFERAYGLRYGENPHQSGAFYVERGAPKGSLACAESLGAGGKELSFNNLVDADAALEAVREFERPAAVVVKHTNPCGVAVAGDLAGAYRAARDADPLSAFGGIVALNRQVDVETAKLLSETFLECVVAPSFAADALEVLRAKRNLRLLATGEKSEHAAVQFKRVSGGLVVQSHDATAAEEVMAGKVVSKRSPSEAELRTLEFAWRVCKHVKSNAIVLGRRGEREGEERTVGVGAGQMSRVVSVQIACDKAGDDVRGAVLASDAFFPFSDGVETAAKHGVVAIAQPGGSVKDADVIAAADRLGLAMIFTGSRHFRH